MLILSRRVEQGFLLPDLGISVRILQIRGRTVKVGVQAPKSVTVLRGELAPGSAAEGIAAETIDAEKITTEAIAAGMIAPGDDPLAAAREDEHRLRNQLNVLQLRLEALQARIDRGEPVDAGPPRPRFDPEGVPDAVAEMSSAFGHRPAAGAKPIRLLLVEDCDNERSLMAQILSSQGFVVQVARDGNEAFQQMITCRSSPDFVLMDMQMPLAGGAETLRRLRLDRRFANLKVFAVTGLPRTAGEAPTEGNWDGWFQKPIDVASLVARIRHEHDRAQIPSSVVSA